MSKNSILRKQKRKQEIEAEKKKKRKKQQRLVFPLVLPLGFIIEGFLDTIFHRPFTHERLNHKVLRGAKQGEHEIEPGVYLSGKGTE